LKVIFGNSAPTDTRRRLWVENPPIQNYRLYRVKLLLRPDVKPQLSLLVIIALELSPIPAIFSSNLPGAAGGLITYVAAIKTPITTGSIQVTDL
jgi:hypothetical protein